jgi:hypothetical protein
MKNLTTAIFAKCGVATDLYSDVGGRIYKGRAPEGASYPYVVFFLVSDMPAGTFTEDIEDVLIQFSLFSKTSSSTEIEDMFTHLKALYDDCSLSVTGNTFLYMHRQNTTAAIEDHTTPTGEAQVWAYYVDYSIMMKKN